MQAFQESLLLQESSQGFLVHERKPWILAVYLRERDRHNLLAARHRTPG
jgi:hypothetical protein